LAERVLIGLVVGIAAGAFFGELAHSLKIVGDAFIMLLQVAVIPYIVASLITALGRLTLDDAKKLGLKAGGVLLVLWAVGATVLLLTPLAFPDGPSASFFSMSQVEEVKPVDFLKLYIPANPFASLANTVIPAIVVFNVLIGVALIGVKNKQSVLEPLSAIAEALMAVTGLVARLAPYGAFALAASAAPWFASVFPGTRRRSHSRGPCCSRRSWCHLAASAPSARCSSRSRRRSTRSAACPRRALRGPCSTMAALSGRVRVRHRLRPSAANSQAGNSPWSIMTNRAA
jgi:hypothetical protein